ncbi:MAG: DJ-1/PfpI family protein [Nitrospinaceae bacterium]
MVLVIIPRNQFVEEELFPILNLLKEAGKQVVVLSPTGREATGMKKEKFTPQGMLADWDKQTRIRGKYAAVLVLGGKGAPKSLWPNDLLPQILTDHFRAGRVVGAIGLGLPLLARAGLLPGEAAAPEDPAVLEELDRAGICRAPTKVFAHGKVLTAEGAEAAAEFARALLQILEENAAGMPET